MPRRVAAICLAAALVCSRAPAQTVSQRGFVEGTGFAFPQQAANDPTRIVEDLLARDEVFVTPVDWLQLAGGVDVRANSHDQVEHAWRVDFSDRGIRRPRFSIRRLAADVHRGRFDVSIGKQFIRWGKTDIVTPTDRFAPRDFLNVIDSDFLAVTGVRASARAGSDTFEGVWVPRFTPGRVPLLDQRWTVVPPGAAGVRLVDAGSVLPRGSQIGLRWSHVGDGFEYAATFFDGFNYLPDIGTALVGGASPEAPPEVAVSREYPPIRMYGGSAAVPTRWLTIKGEAGYFTSASRTTDEYVLYVVQLERQTGEWLFVGGYAGEAVTRRRAALTFAPDRGLTRSLVGRASYTIDTNRDLVFEAAVRQNGDGAYVKGEYSQAYGGHWRATLDGIAIRGQADDFLGQYRRNSYAAVTLRYSF
ncbi:MAG: hypothetical protein ACM3SQ_15510 [Betaproteobacteria bacterium]